MMSRYFLSFVLLTAACFAHASTFLDRIWADDAISAVRLSPDGRHYAYIHRKAVIDEIHIINIADNTRSLLSSRRDSQFIAYDWVDTNNIVVTEVSYASGEWPSYVIHSYDTRMRKNRGTFNEPSRSAMSNLMQTNTDIAPSIMNPLPAVPELVLVNVPTASFFADPRRRRDELGGGRPNVVSLNVKTGQSRELVRNPGNIDYWLSDSTGNVRIGVKLFGKRSFLVRDHNEQDFRPLNLPDNGYPIGFLPGDNQIMVLFDEDKEYDTVGFRIYDLANGRFTTRMLRDQKFDMAEPLGTPSLRKDPETGSILGIYYHTDFNTTLWLNPQLRDIQKRIDLLMPQLTNILLGFTHDGNRLLFMSMGDVEPGRLLELDVAAGTIASRVEMYPQLQGDDLLPIRPISFTARDGATIHGYLTLPRNFVPGSPVPFINIVHGGPAARDTWGFGVSNREAQFFAERGFAVMNVNYRGSTGYGRAYQGETMLFAAQYGVEDVADGTRWAIAEGIADPRRCVIAGASFGGYSALASATREPDLYQVVVGAMGVYDWFEIIRFDAEKSHPLVWEILKARYGDYEGADEPKLRHWSPVFNADNIRAPVLLMHGVNDRRVDIKQYEMMLAALARSRVTHEGYRYTLGGHGFSEQRGWVAYYRRMAEFIDKHLPQ
jgi:dienelactone hydrolase